MRRQQTYWMITVLFIALMGIGSIIYLLRTPVVDMPVNVMIPVNIPQDVYAYLDEVDLHQPLLSTTEQQQHRQQFLTRYFHPWDDFLSLDKFCITANNQNCYSILAMQQEAIDQWTKDRGYDQNYSDRDQDWLTQLVDNMDLNSFPNAMQTRAPLTGIVIHNSALRQVPGDDPGYAQIDQPGEGYPFDYLQQSAIWLGTPVQIIHYSKDKQWLLIEAAGLLGWIKWNDVAYVDEAFIKAWQSSDQFVTLTKRKTNLWLDDAMPKPVTLYLGTLLPTQAQQLLLPVMGVDHFAKIIQAPLNAHALQRWPLSPTPAQFANLMNDILGMPYGWGGIGFNDDCSGTLRNLLTAFAIWLPRNSYSQAHLTGEFYPLPISQYPVATRQQLLQPSSIVSTDHTLPLIPFLTLISFGNTEQSINHIGLYVGHTAAHEVVIFQNIWGLHIVDRIHQRNLGRAIIGRTVLSTLDTGKKSYLGRSNFQLISQWEKPGFNVTVLK